ncbi:hypothetical protein CDAR_312261 [Caerostris darwini]|uniref:Uncharacterized protein n=1 Tax=Caerostris darwini TaxID=1538125 RepID=A0AAV4QQ11_9ARAC|nr:hypothetical protein CDAR_312261 [Caerostris darwini]
MSGVTYLPTYFHTFMAQDRYQKKKKGRRLKLRKKYIDSTFAFCGNCHSPKDQGCHYLPQGNCQAENYLCHFRHKSMASSATIRKRSSRPSLTSGDCS